MTPEEAAFEAEFAERASDEPALVVDVEGFEGPARSAADAGAPAEGRSREDLDPGARRPIPRLHRGGAAAAARACRRLSRDGGLARLSQVAPAAAGDGDAGRHDRGGDGERAGAAPQAAGSDPRRRAEIVRASAARPRRVRARRSPSRSRISSIRNGRRRSTTCSPPMPCQRQKTRALACAHGQARGVVARRGARGARTPGRRRQRLDPHRRISDRLYGRAVAARHGAGVELRLRARDGARGRGGNPPAGGVRAALHAQARACRRTATVLRPRRAEPRRRGPRGKEEAFSDEPGHEKNHAA